MENTKRTPLGDLNTTTGTSTPPKRLYSKSKQTPNDVVQATDDNRCSVEKLSQWLANESAKKQQPIVRSNTSNGTPLRFRTTPKLKAADVQATEDRRASVKTLSTWMNDDPFEKNQKRPIRRGARVIAKSRIFEKQTNNIGLDIQAGSVQNKQDWLKEAFKTDRTDANTATKRSLPSSAEVSSYQQSKKKRESPEKEVFNTVKDKKEWLAGAFKHNNGGNTPNIQASKTVERGDNNIISITSEHVVATSATNGKETYLDEDKEDNSSDLVSVANRAEWLRSAFDKK